MFRVARGAGRAELAPQMVAQMLGRFGVVLIACAILAMLCWALDRPRDEALDKRSGLWWKAQGAASALMLGLALFLHLGLMPRILAMQSEVLGGVSGAGREALRASFDAAHHGYSRFAGFLLWAALFALGCLARRGLRE